jgi:hypothetical protein
MLLKAEIPNYNNKLLLLRAILCNFEVLCHYSDIAIYVKGAQRDEKQTKKESINQFGRYFVSVTENPSIAENNLQK